MSRNVHVIVRAIWRLLMTLMLISLLTGCSYWSAMSEYIPFVPKKKANETVVKNLWTSGEQYVAIQKQDSQPGVGVKPNQHISEISVDRIRTLLESMDLRQTANDKTIALFNEEEIKILSEYIPVGLALAGPDEDVTFAVIGHYVESLGFLKKREVTTGRVFCQNGQINIIFGDVHRELKETMGRAEDRRLNPFLPGSRSGSMGYMDGSILPKQGSEMFNKIRQDWLVFQLTPGEERSLAAASQEERPIVRAATTGTLSPAPNSLASGPQETAAPAQQYTAQPAAPAYVPQAAAPRYTAAPQYTPQNYGARDTRGIAAAPPVAKKSYDERLIILNDLRNKRLITEQEYRDKRQQILDEL